MLDYLEQGKTSFFLYSPFSTEVVQLPHLGEPLFFEVGTFSLDATCPKCLIFVLGTNRNNCYVLLVVQHGRFFSSIMVSLSLILLLMLLMPKGFSIVFSMEVNVELKEWSGILIDQRFPGVLSSLHLVRMLEC